MSSSAQVRQKLAVLSKQRSDHEARLADARGRQAKKNEEAASYRQRAMGASAASLISSYSRQAEDAEKAALAEGRKIADESKRIAACSSKEAALNKDLMVALASEAAAEKRNRGRQDASDRREQERLGAAAKRQHDQEMLAERAR
jgi:hypothetical protein